MFRTQSLETAHTIVAARFKQFHRAFAALSIAAAVAGFTIVERSVNGVNLFLLIPIFIALRFRFWLDDEAYFEQAATDTLPGYMPSRFAIPVELTSWMLWLAAGFLLPRVETSSLLLLLAVIPPICWMVASMIEKLASTQQVERLCFSLILCLGIFLISNRASAWNPFAGQAELFTTLILAALGLVLAVDLIARSKIFTQLQSRPEEDSRLWRVE